MELVIDMDQGRRKRYGRSGNCRTTFLISSIELILFVSFLHYYFFESMYSRTSLIRTRLYEFPDNTIRTPDKANKFCPSVDFVLTWFYCIYRTTHFASPGPVDGDYITNNCLKGVPSRALPNRPLSGGPKS